MYNSNINVLRFINQLKGKEEYDVLGDYFRNFGPSFKERDHDLLYDELPGDFRRVLEDLRNAVDRYLMLEHKYGIR